MRELIDRGYIYIAQAPLYKVTRGKSEQYLKNEHALEDYLTDTGLEDAVFRPIRATNAPAPTSRRSSRRRARSATCSSGLHTPLQPQGGRAGGDRGRAHADDLRRCAEGAGGGRNTSRKRLDALSEEIERGWQGTFIEGEGFHFERTVRGVKEVAIIDAALLGSADARKLDEHAASAAGDLCASKACCAARARIRRSTARSACSRRSPPRAARASRCSATRASAR